MMFFADNSSDEDDERPTMGGGRKKAAHRDYQAPVNFVSGGVQGTKKKEGDVQDE